jgi:hypothetical protein
VAITPVTLGREEELETLENISMEEYTTQQSLEAYNNRRTGTEPTFFRTP